MVSCVVINYNGKAFLQTCLESLAALEYVDKEIIIIDNNSTDDSVDFLKKHFPKVRLIANSVNSGYAGAANQAIDVSSGEYIMILNPDIVFEPEYLSILVERLVGDDEIGAIIGKLRRFDFVNRKKTMTIDSAGLQMYKNRRCVDRGQGEKDVGQYDSAEEVFGITGACPLYRRSALEACRIGGEIFDESFFMYKEDVDISWRLNMLGWICFYEPAAIAYHVRGTGVLVRNSMADVAKNRSGLSAFQKFHSYKNERLMRVKNDRWSDVLRDFHHIAWKELLMTGWMTLREPYLWKSLVHFFRKLPHALKKRGELLVKMKALQKPLKKVRRYFK